MPVENIGALKERLRTLLQQKDLDALTGFISDLANKDFLVLVKKSLGYLQVSRIDEEVSELVSEIKAQWFCAIDENNLALYPFFKALGINVNSRDASKNTALKVAIRLGHLDWVNVLLKDNDVKFFTRTSKVELLPFFDALHALNNACLVRVMRDYDFSVVFSTLLETPLPENFHFSQGRTEKNILNATFERLCSSHDYFNAAETLLTRLVLPMGFFDFLEGTYAQVLTIVYERDSEACLNMLDIILKNTPIAQRLNHQTHLLRVAIQKSAFSLAIKIKQTCDGEIDYTHIQHAINDHPNVHDKTFSLDVFGVLFEGNFKGETLSTEIAVKFAKKLLPVAFENERWNAIQTLIAFQQGRLFKDEALQSTFFCLAAKEGRVNLMEAALTEQANVNVQDSNGCTPLFYAILKQHSLCVSWLIQKGASLYVASNEGIKPYQLETSSDVATLIQNEIEQNINHVGEDGTTALVRAINSKDVKQVREILSKGASITQKNSFTMRSLRTNRVASHSLSVLNHALMVFNAEILEVLILAGAKLNFSEPMSLLGMDMLNKLKLLLDKKSTHTDDDRLEIIQRLFRKMSSTTANLEMGTEQSDDKAHEVMFYILSICDDNIKMVSLVCSFASYFGFSSVLQCIFDNQYPNDINAVGLVKREYTALMLAVQNNHLETVQLLLSQAAINVGYTTTQGEHALMVCDSPMVIQAFLDAGYFYKESAKSAFNAIGRAIFSRNHEIIERILDSGFKDDVPSEFKALFFMRPYFMDVYQFSLVNEIAGLEPKGYELFLKYGVSLEHARDNGRTLLMQACNNGDRELVCWLLIKGVDESVVCNEGKQALDYIEGQTDDSIKLFNDVAFHMVANQKKVLMSGRCLLSSFDTTIALCQRIKLTSDNRCKKLTQVNELRFLKAQQAELEFCLSSSGKEECMIESINTVTKLYKEVEIIDDTDLQKDSLYTRAQYAAGEFLHQLYREQETGSVAATALMSKALEFFGNTADNRRTSSLISSAIGYDFNDYREYPVAPSALVPKLIAEASSLKKESNILKRGQSELQTKMDLVLAENDALQSENTAQSLEINALRLEISALQKESRTKRQRSHSPSAFFQANNMAATSSSSHVSHAVTMPQEEGSTCLSQK